MHPVRRRAATRSDFLVQGLLREAHAQRRSRPEILRLSHAPTRIVFALLTTFLLGCAPTSSAPAPGLQAGVEREVLVATTTTAQDTGLLEVLIPAFEQATGYRVKTIVQGTGAVLAIAVRGGADLVLSHSPEAERRWMADGYGLERRLVMYNDFILVGPASDPAHVRAVGEAAAALRTIADAGATFVSRGDGSGTHARELALWARAGLDPKGRPWYVESGSGQGQNLTIADQRDAYALTDRGTWLVFQPRLRLALLLEGDPGLLNLYHVMPVNPDRVPGVTLNTAGARAFADFLVGPPGQAVIAEFGREQLGRALFTPAAGKREEDLSESP